MKITISILFMIQIFSNYVISQQQIVITNNKAITQFNRVEIGVQVDFETNKKINAFVNKIKSNDIINPFNPIEIKVWSEFYYLDSVNNLAYKPILRNGFFYQQFTRGKEELEWNLDSSEYIFRVRLAPPFKGKWKCKTYIKLKNSNDKVALNDVVFNVLPSNGNLGPVNRQYKGNINDRYLVYTYTGETFFAKSLNLAWTSLDKLRTTDYEKYKQWINKFSSNGGNFVQLGMFAWNYGIEWEKLGDYSNRMANAWELDALFDLCESNNVYINMALSVHDEFIEGKKLGWFHENNGWEHNPYYSLAKNSDGTYKNSSDFFTNQNAIEYFKQKLYYIQARWGYSANLIIYELNTELDNSLKSANYDNDLQLRKNVLNWFESLRSYIKSDLGDNKMVSVSYTQNKQIDDVNERIFSIADVVLLHHYGTRIATNWRDRYNETFVMLNNPLTKNKPILFDEMGATFPTLDNCSDITFHCNIWATSFMGCFGTGMNWWWDNAILIKNYETNFKAINTYFYGEQLAYKKFKNAKAKSNGIGKKISQKTRYEAYSLLNEDKDLLMGWIHNVSFFWANQKNENNCIDKCISINGKHIDQGDNNDYKKEAEADNYIGHFIKYKSEKMRFKGLKPNLTYVIKYYSTETGNVIREETINSGKSGSIEIELSDKTISEKYGDVAFKVMLIR